MISFSDYLKEAQKFDPQYYADQQELEAEVFVGRFSPFHIGHANIVKAMLVSCKKHNRIPIVISIDSGKLSKDNPFSSEQRANMIHKVFPKLIFHSFKPVEDAKLFANFKPEDAENYLKLQKGLIITDNRATINSIITKLRDKNIEIAKLYAGDDRITGYMTNVKKLIDDLKDSGIDNPEKRYPKIKPEIATDNDSSGFVQTKRTDVIINAVKVGSSATLVRNALLNDDEVSYKKLMPKSLHGNFEEFKTAIKNV